MRIHSLFAVIVLGLVLAPSPAFCITPALVEQAKKATALVELTIAADRRAFGSSFCIDASGLFITNAHVIGDGDVTGKVHLILSPGDADQRVADATVVTSDKELDLAVLRISTPGHLVPLELGQVSALYDTMEVTAFGYPFGSAMALQPHEYPAVSVNTGHVTSLRKKAGVLELVQLDAALNPGKTRWTTWHQR